MDTPQKLVLAMAAFMIIVLLPAIISPKKFREISTDLVADTKLLRVVGFMTLVIGFVFLSVYYKLTGGWIMTVSILGYIAVLKGIALIWTPEIGKTLYKKYYNTDKFFMIFGIAGILVSIGLIYIALYPLAPVVFYY